MAIVLDKSHRWRLFLSHVGVICLILVCMFPFVMILSISLRPGNFATLGGDTLWANVMPQKISFEHWKLALGISYQGEDGMLITPTYPVLRWLGNSIKVAFVSACIAVLLSTTAAYAFARMKFAGKQHWMTGLLLMQMFPSVLALIAIYAIFDYLGTYVKWLGIDSHWSLILAYAGGIALHVWTIKGYYDTIPGEIEEAAVVDGATHWQAFKYVLLPMALPILMVVFLLAFIGGIIEYPVASVLLHNQDALTLAVGANQFLYPQKYLWGDFAAAAILSGLPITAVFLLSQRWMVSGLTAGGVKG